MIPHRSLPALALTALSACSFVVNLTPRDGEPAEPTPFSNCVSATIGPAGGGLELDGVALDVPAGALAADVEVSLCPGEAPADALPLSNVVAITPADVVLSGPVTLSVPHDATEQPAAYLVGVDGVAVRQYRADEAGDVTVASLYGFGTAYVAFDPRATELRGTSNQADVLFVVDGSGSMMDEHLALETAFAGVPFALSVLDVDYHVGVVSMDFDDPMESGKLHEADGVKWIDADTPDPEVVFEDLVWTTAASGIERGLEATYVALELVADTHNAGFRRDDARLAVICVSDEEDYTPTTVITVPEVIDWFDEATPSLGDGAIHALGVPGTRYEEVAVATGGAFEDIGSADMGAFLESVIGGLGAGFALEQVPDPATIEVWVLPADVLLAPYAVASVLYDSGTNSVSFDTTGLVPEDRIVLVYTVL